jgi:hypothetical protein
VTTEQAMNDVHRVAILGGPDPASILVYLDGREIGGVLAVNVSAGVAYEDYLERPATVSITLLGTLDVGLTAEVGRG